MKTAWSYHHSSGYKRVRDRQTDGRIDGISVANTAFCIANNASGCKEIKNVRKSANMHYTHYEICENPLIGRMSENIAALAGIFRVTSVNSCRAVFKGGTVSTPLKCRKIFLLH